MSPFWCTVSIRSRPHKRDSLRTWHVIHFRAIATRNDKRDDNFLASVQLAAIRIWLQNYESVTQDAHNGPRRKTFIRAAVIKKHRDFRWWEGPNHLPAVQIAKFDHKHRVANATFPLGFRAPAPPQPHRREHPHILECVLAPRVCLRAP